MKKPSMVQKVGSWAFIIGLLIAVVAGFWTIIPAVTSVLIVLGLIVGFLNVTGSETQGFLFASVSLVIVASLGGNVLSTIQVVGPMLQNIFSTIVLFVLPATMVVCLKAIYALAAEE
ncbi:hypothetical protein HY772_08355 [Candidatus Woesearchaeota archaeon]|nr:hypothetical protein [Candidatus Woesearchaeota archaeon]